MEREDRYRKSATDICEVDVKIKLLQILAVTSKPGELRFATRWPRFM